jgi:hypothetical protein
VEIIDFHSNKAGKKGAVSQAAGRFRKKNTGLIELFFAETVAH